MKTYKSIKMNNLVFVYSKDNQIKVLGLEKSRELNKALLSDGWKHTQTIDPCVWIEYLHNKCEDIDIVDEVKSLSNTLH